MKKITKILIAILAVTVTVYSAAAEAQKALPGAALYIYNLTDAVRPNPDAEPISVIVDNGTVFSKHNLWKNKETQKFNGQDLFLVWKGYIAIPSKGMYTFAISYENSPTPSNYVFFQINGKDFLTIFNGRKKTLRNDSRSVALEKGDYEVTVIQRSVGQGLFSIKMWDKSKPLKKFAITPAGMVHVE